MRPVSAMPSLFFRQILILLLHFSDTVFEEGGAVDTINKNEPRRRYPRVDFKGKAVLFFGKDSEVSETAQISEGGLLAFTKMRLKEGDLLTLHFTVNEAYLRARGEVIYVLPTEPDGRTRVGFRFQSLFQEYRAVIRDLTT